MWGLCHVSAIRFKHFGRVGARAARLTMDALGVSDTRKIGIGLSTAGLLFTLLGVFMFFDRGLLAMGNVSQSSPPNMRPIPRPHPHEMCLTM